MKIINLRASSTPRISRKEAGGGWIRGSFLLSTVFTSTMSYLNSHIEVSFPSDLTALFFILNYHLSPLAILKNSNCSLGLSPTH